MFPCGKICAGRYPGAGSSLCATGEAACDKHNEIVLTQRRVCCGIEQRVPGAGGNQADGHGLAEGFAGFPHAAQKDRVTVVDTQELGEYRPDPCITHALGDAGT
jgi:hypothetical protein